MKNIIFLVAALIAFASAQVVGPGCTVDAVAVARTNSWPIEDGIGAIYDISVTNSGSCPAVDIGLSLGLPEESEILSSWNLEASSRYWLLSNFGSQLEAGRTVTAGLILFINTSSTVPTTLPPVAVNIYGTNCLEQCVYPSGRPTSTPTETPIEDTPTEAPTAVPTEAPIDSSSADSTDDSSADSTDSSADSTDDSSSTDAPVVVDCDLESYLNKTHEWVQDGVPYATWALTITNKGSSNLINFTTGFGYYPGEITQTWNLGPSRGGYAVINFGDVLAPGATFNGAGFIVSNATDVQLQIYGTRCEEL